MENSEVKFINKRHLQNQQKLGGGNLQIGQNMTTSINKPLIQPNSFRQTGPLNGAQGNQPQRPELDSNPFIDNSIPSNLNVKLSKIPSLNKQISNTQTQIPNMAFMAESVNSIYLSGSQFHMSSLGNHEQEKQAQTNNGMNSGVNNNPSNATCFNEQKSIQQNQSSLKAQSQEPFQLQHNSMSLPCLYNDSYLKYINNSSYLNNYTKIEDRLPHRVTKTSPDSTLFPTPPRPRTHGQKH